MPLLRVEGATAAEEQHHEGQLVRKHEWESTTKKASNRSWDKIFCVLHGNMFSFYKDQKHYKQEPGNSFRGEQPINLNGSTSAIATDYTKRPHVFRLKLSNGGAYLFQAKDNDEMNTWIMQLNSVAGAEPTSPSRAHTLPTPEKKDEQKKRGFLTLGKKK